MNDDPSISNVFARNWHDFKAAYNSLLVVNFLNTLLIIAVIAVSLLIPLVFYILIQNVTVYTDNINMGRNITVYLEPNVSAEQASVIRDTFARDKRIKEVELITADDALADFSQALGLESNEILSADKNPLPHVIVVTPQDEYTTDDYLEQMASEIKANREVAMVQLDKQWFNRLHSLIAFLHALTTVVSVILLMSVLLTIINSIAARVATHRNEIEVMKLVGATNTYICRPYFYLGLWFGILGSLVAVWLSSLAVVFSESLVNGIAEAYDTHISLHGLTFEEMLLVILVASILAALVSSFCAYENIAKIEPSE